MTDRDPLRAFCDRLRPIVHELDGTPEEIISRFVPPGVVACMMTVDELFDQTPGPERRHALAREGQWRGATPTTRCCRSASIAACFEGLVPADDRDRWADGIPNVTHLSRVHMVDDEHVALSNQFFSKTIQNLAANPAGLRVRHRSGHVRQLPPRRALRAHRTSRSTVRTHAPRHRRHRRAHRHGRRVQAAQRRRVPRGRARTRRAAVHEAAAITAPREAAS